MTLNSDGREALMGPFSALGGILIISNTAVILLPKRDVVRQPKSRFLKVKCLDCENEQIIFGHATTDVTCLKCGKTLAKPSGGKAKLEPIAREVEVLP
jgi:small subunit ribosomal protein S27e